jgi:L-alanine-DL-glutamate epimerase-like enolase superfamily enzyme
MNIYWFEEPLSPDNIKGMTEMAKSLDIRIAAGEAEFSPYGFRDLFVNGAIDVIQPNISRAGGISAGRRIAAMSEAFHIPYAPHTGSCSAVCLAATLQFSVALPNFLIFEYMQSDWSANQPNPLRHDLLKSPAEVFEDGYMVVLDTPGVGAEINEDVLDNYRVA